MTPRFVARQFSQPRGLLGGLIMRLMNRRNASLYVFALQQLDIGTTDRVLEVGFGGGLALSNLVDHAAFTAGVDRSVDAVKRAEARFAPSVALGRAEFRVANVERLSYDARTFTEAVCNTIYFGALWMARIQELARVLPPESRLVVGSISREAMERMKNPPDIFSLRESEEVIAARLELDSAMYGLNRRIQRQPGKSWLEYSNVAPAFELQQARPMAVMPNPSLNSNVRPHVPMSRDEFESLIGPIESLLIPVGFSQSRNERDGPFGSHYAEFADDKNAYRIVWDGKRLLASR